MAALELYKDDQLMSEYTIKDSFTMIGRDPKCELVINHESISGSHACISKIDNAFYIEDNGSSNGTFINSKAIIEKQLLNENDVITIGQFLIKYYPNRLHSASNRVRSETAEIQPASTVMFDPSMLKDILRDHKVESAHSKGKSQAWLLFDAKQKMQNDTIEVTKKGISIGKSKDADIYIRSWFAPKLAAIVEQQANGYYIVPQKSKKNFVNNNRVLMPVKLKDGDLIQIHKINMKFHITIKN